MISEFCTFYYSFLEFTNVTIFFKIANLWLYWICYCTLFCLMFTSFIIWRRQWHPTPVLLPGKSHGWRSLVGCSPWGRGESNVTERLHFHALEKAMATHSSVLAWRIPGTGEPGGLPSMGSHRVGHDWSDAAAAVFQKCCLERTIKWCHIKIWTQLSFRKATIMIPYELEHLKLLITQKHRIEGELCRF